MNNCYLWMRDHGEEYVEEQDRSLQVIEVSWPTVRQPFQIDQVLSSFIYGFSACFDWNNCD